MACSLALALSPPPPLEPPMPSMPSMPPSALDWNLSISFSPSPEPDPDPEPEPLPPLASPEASPISTSKLGSSTGSMITFHLTLSQPSSEKSPSSLCSVSWKPSSRSFSSRSYILPRARSVAMPM